MLECDDATHESEPQPNKLLKFILGKFKTEFLFGFWQGELLRLKLIFSCFTNLRKNFFKYPRFKWFSFWFTRFDDQTVKIWFIDKDRFLSTAWIADIAFCYTSFFTMFFIASGAFT